MWTEGAEDTLIELGGQAELALIELAIEDSTLLVDLDNHSP